ncbi:FACT complex subunit [Kappamyces sp. JEL0680]|nr:FACT complex subunit [Kappamyces sp. JEL0680]
MATVASVVSNFDKIYLGGKNGPLAAGKFKLSEVGIGWKNALSGQIITVSAADITKVTWVRVARDFELRILKKGGVVLKFDGFPKDAFEGLSHLVKQYYSKTLDTIEVSTRGYNWGQAEFQGSQMTFNVHGKQAFEIPLSDVANTLVAGKSEVSVEFAMPRKEKNERILEDSLVEIRFYIPGGVTESMIRDGQGDAKVLKDRLDENGDVIMYDQDEEDGMEQGEISQKVAVDDKGEALTAATLFAETIKQKSDANASLSELIVSFDDILCLTPRGRFQIDMHQENFRLRGKTHDYKILYSAITRMFLVPRPDDIHWNFVVGVNPPLRQGQTRYPFLVFQFEREQEVELTLNMEEYAAGC